MLAIDIINSCTVFRSNDRGLTFTPTALTTIQGDIGGNRLSSPKMAVDPNNADIVYVANQTGIFWVTYNGGSQLVDGHAASRRVDQLQSSKRRSSRKRKSLSLS